MNVNLIKGVLGMLVVMWVIRVKFLIRLYVLFLGVFEG